MRSSGRDCGASSPTRSCARPTSPTSWPARRWRRCGDEPARGVGRRGHRRDPPGRSARRDHRRRLRRTAERPPAGRRRPRGHAEGRLEGRGPPRRDRRERPVVPQATGRGRGGPGRSPARRPPHHRDEARFHLRQQWRRPLERRARVRRPAPDRLGPFGPSCPRHRPGPARLHGRCDRERHVRPAVAKGAHGRRDRRGRDRRRRRPAGCAGRARARDAGDRGGGGRRDRGAPRSS